MPLVSEENINLPTKKNSMLMECATQPILA